MNIFLTIIAILGAVYGFAAIGYYYAFKNWSPMCGSRKSASASTSAKTIQWLLRKQEEGRKSERDIS